MLKIPVVPSANTPKPTVTTWPSSRARYGTPPGRAKASRRAERRHDLGRRLEAGREGGGVVGPVGYVGDARQRRRPTRGPVAPAGPTPGGTASAGGSSWPSARTGPPPARPRARARRGTGSTTAAAAPPGRPRRGRLSADVGMGGLGEHAVQGGDGQAGHEADHTRGGLLLVHARQAGRQRPEGRDQRTGGAGRHRRPSEPPFVAAAAREKFSQTRFSGGGWPVP